MTYIDLSCYIGGRIDYLRAAEHFIIRYRAGKLGRITLDSISDLNHNHIQ